MVVFYFDKNTHTLSLCLSFFCMLLWVCVLGFVLFFCVGFNWHLFLKMEEAIVVFYRNCRAETKKSLQRRKKIMWWDRGKVMVWRMSCVNGRWVWVWWEESGLGRNEEEEKKKKKKKKEKRWFEGWDRTQKMGATMSIYLQKCHWKQSYGNWKQLKCVFNFHNSSLKNQRIEWWKQKLEIELLKSK